MSRQFRPRELTRAEHQQLTAALKLHRYIPHGGGKTDTIIRSEMHKASNDANSSPSLQDRFLGNAINAAARITQLNVISQNMDRSLAQLHQHPGGAGVACIDA